MIDKEEQKDYSIEIVSKKELKKDDCISILDINSENHHDNGGQLHYRGLWCDYVALAKKEDDLIGYTMVKALSNGYRKEMYVVQVAVDDEHKSFGIGNQMYLQIYNHLGGFNLFSADVYKHNPVSQNFHENFGFDKMNESENQYHYVKPVDDDVKLTMKDAVEEGPQFFNFNTQEKFSFENFDENMEYSTE